MGRCEASEPLDHWSDGPVPFLGVKRGGLVAALAAMTVAIAGCGGNSAADLANNLKSFLNAQSVQQVQCQANGTDGNGNKLRTCSVAYTDKNGSAMQANGVEVAGDKPTGGTFETNPAQ